MHYWHCDCRPPEKKDEQYEQWYTVSCKCNKRQATYLNSFQWKSGLVKRIPKSFAGGSDLKLSSPRQWSARESTLARTHLQVANLNKGRLNCQYSRWAGHTAMQVSSVQNLVLSCMWYRLIYSIGDILAIENLQITSNNCQYKKSTLCMHYPVPECSQKPHPTQQNILPLGSVSSHAQSAPLCLQSSAWRFGFGSNHPSEYCVKSKLLGLVLKTKSK